MKQKQPIIKEEHGGKTSMSGHLTKSSKEVQQLEDKQDFRVIMETKIIHPTFYLVRTEH